MGTFTRGDLVLFPFPYTDLSARKLRPCLVLSEVMKDDIILCQITSQKIPRDAYSIALRMQETRDGSLKIDSYIRANMIFTASKDQILKRVCKLSDDTYNRVIETIIKIIKK